MARVASLTTPATGAVVMCGLNQRSEGCAQDITPAVDDPTALWDKEDPPSYVLWRGQAER
jgi:hypothetical protein